MNEQSIIQTYSQSGGDLPFFVGKQYGAGWLQTIGRFAFPILKKLANVAGRTAEDVLVSEKPVLESLRNNAIQEVSNVVNGGSKSSSSINRSKRRKRKRSTQAPPFFSKKPRQQ